MCPHETADVLPTDESEMVQVPLTNGNANGKRGTTRSNTAHLEQQRRNPYAPRAADFLSNISNFNIIESTLRGLFYIFNARMLIADFLIFRRG
jgi:homocitrate synthase